MRWVSDASRDQPVGPTPFSNERILPLARISGLLREAK